MRAFSMHTEALLSLHLICEALHESLRGESAKQFRIFRLSMLT